MRSRCMRGEFGRLVSLGSHCVAPFNEAATPLQPDIARIGGRYNPLQRAQVVLQAPRSKLTAARSANAMIAKPPAPKILVVDDDVRLRDLLTRYLAEQGFVVSALADSSQLDKKLQRDPPHLIVLDLMLPGEDGLSVCRRLRGAGEMVPIIMLTAKGEDVDRIVGLEMGADDYLPKPFNPRELVARIHAVLRRQTERLAPGAPAADGSIQFGPFVLDLSTRMLKRNDEPITLTTGEFALLKALAM